jgi:hypothetical protein
MNALAFAPRIKDLIEELPAIVSMQFSYGKGQMLADVMHSTPYSLLSLAPNRLALGPAGRDIDRH